MRQGVQIGWLCFVLLSLWAAASVAQAQTRQAQLVPAEEQSFGVLLTNKSYFLRKRAPLVAESLGTLRQASTFGVEQIVLSVLPVMLSVVLVLTAIVGGLSALLLYERGRFAWGILNLVSAGCALIAGVVFLALGWGVAGLVLMLSAAALSAVGVPALYVSLKARRRKTAAYHTSENTLPAAGFRLRTIAPAGVTFSF